VPPNIEIKNKINEITTNDLNEIFTNNNFDLNKLINELKKH
jgi:hypothetical protein